MILRFFSSSFVTFLLVMNFFVFFHSCAHAAWVFPDLTADVETDKTALSDRWNEILADGKTLASADLTATSQLPHIQKTVGIWKVDLDASQYTEELRPMGYIALFVALLASFFIIFS